MAVRRAGRAVVFAAAGSMAFAGCVATGVAGEPEASAVAVRIDAPVHHPVWSENTEVLLAMVEGSTRIAKIAVPEQPGSPRTARTTISEPLLEVGQNIATSPTGHEVVYVPQPRLGRVAVVDVGRLRQVAALPAGRSPSYVAEDAGSRVLLVMSEDGSTVTAVDLQERTVLPPQQVRAGPLAEVHGGKRGRRIDYHVAGPEGVAVYKGSPSSVAKQGEIALSAGKSAGDLVKPSRLYVAEAGADRLFAVDMKRSLHGLKVVARTSLGAPVTHLGVDETRVYAATEETLVVLETNSFEGYESGTFPVVEEIDFRGALAAEELKDAPLSGLAVGRDRVYLTLTGQPYLVSVPKPRV